MSPVRRLLIVAAAWVVPAAWLAVALSAGPSDGTLVSATALTGSERWGSSATVQRAYGDTLLRQGDEVQKIGGHTFGEWVAEGAATDRDVGDVVAYEVRRLSPEGDALDLSLDVTLTRYPLPDALGQNLSTLVAVLLVLLAGSVVFWLAAGTATAAAFLAGCALLPVGLTSAPCGLGAVDVAGGRGLWPHLVGEIAFAVGLGLLLLAALTFRAPPGWLRARPWVALVVVVVPAVGYAVWIGGPARGLTPEAARLQALITIAAPAALAVVPAVLLALTWRYLRAPTRDDVLACRLALLTIVAGLVALLLLGVIPEQVTGQPLLPWGVLVLLLSPAVLALLVVAIVGYRLDEIEPDRPPGPGPSSGGRRLRHRLRRHRGGSRPGLGDLFRLDARRRRGRPAGAPPGGGAAAARAPGGVRRPGPPPASGVDCGVSTDHDARRDAHRGAGPPCPPTAAVARLGGGAGGRAPRPGGLVRRAPRPTRRPSTCRPADTISGCCA